MTESHLNMLGDQDGTKEEAHTTGSLLFSLHEISSLPPPQPSANTFLFDSRHRSSEII